MAQYGGQYGVGQTDQYGNHQMQPNGENMVGSDFETRSAVSDSGNGTGSGGHHQNQHQHHSLSEMLQHSGNSGFSKDEAQGSGRKKKGLTEKIKEKIPGIRANTTDFSMYSSYVKDTNNEPAVLAPRSNEKPSQITPPTTANTTGTTIGGEGHEKKGIMDKIKDKLPGTH